MARSILANPPSKLNLSRRQADLFQKIILTGNHMADGILDQDKQLPLPKDTVKLATRWGKLMVELVRMLI